MATQRASVVWVDANGATRATLITTAAGAAAVEAALLAKSRADVLDSWEGDLIANPTPSPVPGAYQSVRDAAILTFTSVGSDLITITLPAPLASIFLADQETVDATQITAIIAAVIANSTTASGSPAVAFVSGIRRRSNSG